MAHRVMPPESGQLWRSLHFRPPDPVWAPHETLERLRARIKQYDRYYDVWWQSNNGIFDPVRPGRWVVKHWSANTGNWSTWLVWQTESGGYRDPDAIDAIISQALSGDPAFNGKNLKEEDAKAEEHNQKLDEKRKAARRAKNWEQAHDLAASQSGKRITIGVTDRRSKRSRRAGAVKLC